MGGIRVAHQKSFGGTGSDSLCHLRISGISARKICYPTPRFVIDGRKRTAPDADKERRKKGCKTDVNSLYRLGISRRDGGGKQPRQVTLPTALYGSDPTIKGESRHAVLALASLQR
jgi:hypothetical protein